MSRIGKKIIDIPSGVKISVEKSRVVVEGPKGKLETPLPEGIQVEQAESNLVAKRENDSKRLRSLHGLTRALLANSVKGVTKGFEKKLDVVGIGYRAERRGKYLNLSLGHSHPVELPVPEGVEIKVEREQRAISNYVATITIAGGRPISEWGRLLRISGPCVRLIPIKERGSGIPMRSSEPKLERRERRNLWLGN